MGDMYNTDRLQQLEYERKINELIITGVPYFFDESLWSTYLNLINIFNVNVGQPPAPLVHIYRKVNSSHSSFTKRKYEPAVILIRFRNLYDKEIFFYKYIKSLRSNKLISSDLTAFENVLPINRVRIMENLTIHNYQLYCEARNLKKKGYISSVITLNGHVHIYYENVFAKKIQNLDELLTIVCQKHNNNL